MTTSTGRPWSQLNLRGFYSNVKHTGIIIFCLSQVAQLRPRPRAKRNYSEANQTGRHFISLSLSLVSTSNQHIESTLKYLRRLLGQTDPSCHSIQKQQRGRSSLPPRAGLFDSFHCHTCLLRRQKQSNASRRSPEHGR